MTTADRHPGLLLVAAAVLVVAAGGCRDDAVSTSSTAEDQLTAREWGEGLKLCLERAGVTVIEEGAGSFSYDPGPGMSRQAMGEIEAECRQDLGPLPAPPTDAATARKYYVAYVETAECLEKLGYAVTQPPSVEVFTDQFAEGTGGFWDPFEGVYEQFPSVEAQTEAEQQCTVEIEQ